MHVFVYTADNFAMASKLEDEFMSVRDEEGVHSQTESEPELGSESSSEGEDTDHEDTDPPPKRRKVCFTRAFHALCLLSN